MQRLNPPGEVKPSAKPVRRKICKSSKPPKKSKEKKVKKRVTSIPSPIPGLTTIKQNLFVKNFIVDFNVTRSAIAAGYSKKNAAAIGSNLLQNPHVQNAIQKEIDKRMNRLDIQQDMVISELFKLAFSDISQFVSWSPDGVVLKSSDELPAYASSCVSEVSQSVNQFGNNIKFKLHDKTKALELLARHLGMFTDKVEVNAKVVRKDEQKYHIIQEVISQPEVVDRIRENFRLRFRDDTGSEQL
jgi:phage terminase small subunit